MNLFFDTSALVKYFYPEVGTDQVVALMDNAENRVWVSDLARIEFVSALHRKFRQGHISNTQLQEALSLFGLEWSQWHHQPMNDAVMAAADQLMCRQARQYALRTLDAIHLASFILLAEEGWKFVVSDGVLANAASAENSGVIRIAL